MKILRDYILKEFFHSFFLSVVVFTFVLLVGNIIQLADLVINKGVDFLSVMKLFFFLIPWLLSFTLPIAALTAVSAAMGRVKERSHGMRNTNSFRTENISTPLFMTRSASCIILPTRRTNVKTTTESRKE